MAHRGVCAVVEAGWVVIRMWGNDMPGEGMASRGEAGRGADGGGDGCGGELLVAGCWLGGFRLGAHFLLRAGWGGRLR